MAKTRHALIDSERDERRARQRQLMTDAVQALRSSDGWRSYLKARGAFHSYSARNVLLICAQHPTATRVAGFRAWLNLGYSVRKGEKSIKIWAPCPPSKKQLRAWRAAGADPDERPRTCWRLASVFAQDQVDPLPPPAQPASLELPEIAAIEGDSHGELLTMVGEVAADIGYELIIEDLPAAIEGICRHQPRTISVAQRLSPNGKLAAGIHELAHALVRVDELAGAQRRVVRPARAPDRERDPGPDRRH